MFLSPPEIKQQQLREKKGAYERQDVDTLLDNIVGSYQHVWLERDRLTARVDELEKEIANTKELEKLLRDGLAAAQRAAEQVKVEAEAEVSGLVEEAQVKADKLLEEARAEAEQIVAGSRTERDRLDEETTRLTKANADVRERYKAFLLEALSVVEGTSEHQAVKPENVAVADADESAPVPEADSDAVLEEAGWLATVPLVAVTADSVDESVSEQAEARARSGAGGRCGGGGGRGRAGNSFPVLDPEAGGPGGRRGRARAGARSRGRARTRARAGDRARAGAGARARGHRGTGTRARAPSRSRGRGRGQSQSRRPKRSQGQSPKRPSSPKRSPSASRRAGTRARSGRGARARARSGREPEPEPSRAAEPEPEPEPEPEEDSLAPEEAYMTYKGISAITPDEPKASTPSPKRNRRKTPTKTGRRRRPNGGLGRTTLSRQRPALGTTIAPRRRATSAKPSSASAESPGRPSTWPGRASVR